MARFVSYRNPISTGALKRKTHGSVVVSHGAREDVRFTRVAGGWMCERTDVASEDATIVSSPAVANKCNRAMGCKSSWARIY